MTQGLAEPARMPQPKLVTQIRAAMTTFPIADADRTAPSPVVFPQIADGGGFVTECILLNSGAASKTTLSFFDNEGRQLAVGK